jgi:hypothetical protein
MLKNLLPKSSPFSFSPAVWLLAQIIAQSSRVASATFVKVEAFFSLSFSYF